MNTDRDSTTMTSASLRSLRQLGQAIWLDYIQRHLITSGELRRLVEHSGVTGVTANPSIFEKAILESTDYEDALDTIARMGMWNATEAYETLAIADIQAAAAILRPVYDDTQGRNGFVSLEVSPLLAHDTRGTVEEARRLWAAIGRENVMIKVPGTLEGVPAVRQLTEAGINVNITLLFSRDAYKAVAEAYLAGLHARLARGEDVSRVASVASFFVSRIDTVVDNLIAIRLKGGPDNAEFLRSLLGKAAIANAKLAYQWYQDFIRTDRWRTAAANGARTQRLLWASTSTKNPQYRDVRYVEELIGPETINTITPITLDAFRDHGHARASLTDDINQAQETMAALAEAGISFDAVTTQLLDDGIQLFTKAFDKLLDAIDRKLTSLQPTRRSHSGTQ
jgi:transaldolase/glucose-6-phosphate isomerase